MRLKNCFIGQLVKHKETGNTGYIRDIQFIPSEQGGHISLIVYWAQVGGKFATNHSMTHPSKVRELEDADE